MTRKYGKPIDSNVPLLSGKDLDKYLEQDILTDHEWICFVETFESDKLE